MFFWGICTVFYVHLLLLLISYTFVVIFLSIICHLGIICPIIIPNCTLILHNFLIFTRKPPLIRLLFFTFFIDGDILFYFRVILLPSFRFVQYLFCILWVSYLFLRKERPCGKILFDAFEVAVLGGVLPLERPLLSFDEPCFQVFLDVGQAWDRLPGVASMIKVFPLDEIVHLVVDDLLVEDLLDLVDPVTAAASHLVRVFHMLLWWEWCDWGELIIVCL